MTTPLSATLEVETPSGILERLYPNGKLGGLAVDGRCPGALGQYCLVTVVVKRPARSVAVRGQLAWARHRGVKPGLEPCFGVDFVPEDDAARVRLLAFARNELEPHMLRIEARVQVQLPVRLLHGGAVRREHLADLSSGGAFVRTWDPLGLGEWVDLVLRPPFAFLSTTLRGRVAWVRKTGQAAGMGIEFVDEDGTQRPKVTKLLSKLAPGR